MDYKLLSKRRPFTLQKGVFLHVKRASFTMQKGTFWNAKEHLLFCVCEIIQHQVGCYCVFFQLYYIKEKASKSLKEPKGLQRTYTAFIIYYR